MGAVADALLLIDDFGAANAAAAVVSADGVVVTHGPVEHPFPLASVTKPLVAYATLAALTNGALALDDPAGPPRSTVAHLLAHASGLGPEAPPVVFEAPARHRIYSNAGYEVLADHLEHHCGTAIATMLHDTVFAPLDMASTRLEDSPASGGVGTVADLCRFVGELFTPRLIEPAQFARATTVAFPGLVGVLPGFGRQVPCDFGLGFEIRGHKGPHWTGSANSPSSFGHFGKTGTFFWVDPSAGIACVYLGDRPFGPWAAAAWPVFADAVLTGWATDTAANGGAPTGPQR